MFGFAIFSVLINLSVGLVLLSCLIFVINFVVYRSLKFYKTKWNCLGALWGTVVATGILGTVWNLSQGANAKYGWYNNFIHMPLYGALFGGYLGWIMGEQIVGKAPKNIRPWLVGVSIAIAVAAFYGYLYTGAISYGDS
ncbi:hypothetical protein [Pseudanabaena sp. Chao 1811]|uniref:hypothetical protein n=1 Tax=Pseudanabaena sp. Chao 1811 TaxID=2963092 RepID=UPI0022F3CA21|nr:hypothetical protein [Pseudanabaena sp. Chao 1811]